MRWGFSLFVLDTACRIGRFSFEALSWWRSLPPYLQAVLWLIHVVGDSSSCFMMLLWCFCGC